MYGIVGIMHGILASRMNEKRIIHGHRKLRQPPQGVLGLVSWTQHVPDHTPL